MVSTQKLNKLVRLFSGEGAREGYLAAVDQGAISLANFLATVILARNISPTELGVYGVGFTTLRLVRSFQEGLVVQPMNTYGAAMDEAGFRRYATSTTILQVLLAIVSAAAVALCGWVATVQGNDVAGPTLFSLWPAFLWWQLQEYIRRMLYTRGQVFDAVFNTLIANAVRLVLMVVWARQGRLTGIAGLNAISLGSLVALLPGLWQTRSCWTLKPASLIGTWKQNWGFGRWMLGASIANWVAVEFYPILTAGMISFAAAGAYRALQNLVAPVNLLLRAVDTFLTPRAAKAYAEQGRPALVRLLRLTYAVSGVPIIGWLGIAILLPVPLLHFLYGDTYLEYSGAMSLMGLFYLLWFSYWPLQTTLKAAHIGRPIFVANLSAIMAMFTIGIWFIQLWGVYGTIAGQALNAAVVSVIHWAAWFRSGKKRRTTPG